MKFFTVDESKKKRRTIGFGNRALAALIKAGMGWNMAQPICAPGIMFSDENVIIFDLKQAYIQGQKPVEKKGLCVIPTPAAPFLPVPPEYFSNDAPIVEVEGVVVSA